jgi:hypothetical protein
MKRALLFLLLFGCGTGTLPNHYAVVLDKSLGDLAPAVHQAVAARLTNADFIDTVLPADKHEAIIVIRGECTGREDCGPQIPTTYAYEIYRDDKVVRNGRTGTSEYTPPNGHGYMGTNEHSGIAPEKLAGTIVRDLRRM